MTIDGMSGLSIAPQDISGAVTSVIVRYVRARVGDFGVAQMLAASGEARPVHVLEDPRSWSTHDEAIALLAAAAQVTGDAEIARHVGEEMLRQHDGTDVANLLRSLGSPAELLRNVTAAAAKFTTVSSLEPLEVGDAHAVVQALARPGYMRHLYMCEFTKGLLAQVPVLFGLVPAVVTETECQARGGRFCLYSVAWEARQWTSFVDDRTSLFSMAWEQQGVVEARSELEMDADTRISMLEEQLRQMGERLEEVFSTASDLLSVEDLSELLASITRRAAGAVNAPRYLLVVQTGPDEPLHLHHHGFNENEARALAAELWQPNPSDLGGSRLIVDIASSRHRYGRLAAIQPPGLRFMAREREIFSLYANYAATALDLVTSLAESRRSNATARALLDFSRALSRVGTTEEVSQTLADTVPAVASCERAAVLLWDPFDQKLVLRASSGANTGENGGGQPAPGAGGAPAAGEPIIFDVAMEVDFSDEEANKEKEPFSISADQTPLINGLLTSRDIVVIDRNIQDEFLRALLESYGTVVTIMTPLFSDEEFLGVVAADFFHAPPTDPRTDRDLKERLQALADQAATAFQNAWLLEQVGHLAWHDALTGLPNRRLLEDRVHQELERAKRVGEPSSMFFVDLDRFKKVNDTLGHAAGDDLIRQVAQRLRDVVRRQDTVARLGGDEFAVLLPGLNDITAIRQLADRMLESLHTPYSIEGAEVYTSASIGIAMYPEHGETYDDLLSHADEAMYLSKSMGRNTYNVYETEGGGVANSVDAHLEADLHHAIDRNELFVLYQPYIDLETNQMVGVEALVRWRHPVKGVLEPGSFIAQAEESDLILAIDEFVIREAARQMREWLNEGMPPLRVSVNVSGRDLLHPGFVDTVMSALTEHRVAPEWFEIEITERVTIDEGGVMRNTADQLRERGVRFSIDDFGTGTSSIQQVAAFPVSTLKIDQSFVQILGPTEELNALAAGIISMADKLGLECVAEGVETHHQSRVLLQRGCTTAQGFFFSPPLLPGDVRRMMETSPTEATVSPVAPTAASPVGDPAVAS
jgi:diguanylate cyclase (GGDEF)-like protein